MKKLLLKAVKLALKNRKVNIAILSLHCFIDKLYVLGPDAQGFHFVRKFNYVALGFTLEEIDQLDTARF